MNSRWSAFHLSVALLQYIRQLHISPGEAGSEPPLELFGELYASAERGELGGVVYLCDILWSNR